MNFVLQEEELKIEDLFLKIGRLKLKLSNFVTVEIHSGNTICRTFIGTLAAWKEALVLP